MTTAANAAQDGDGPQQLNWSQGLLQKGVANKGCHYRAEQSQI